MSTEDRLQAALAARAAVARTSPGALDGVFGRVARHRRNVRIAALASVVAVAVAGTAFATTVRPGRSSIEPVTPTGQPTGQPTRGPAGERVLVMLADGRLAEVSATTGEDVRTFDPITEDLGEDPGLAWDGRYLYYGTADCRVLERDTSTGQTREVTRGRNPDVGPLGAIAAVGCDGKSVVVVDSEADPVETRYEMPHEPTFEDGDSDLSTVRAVAWADRDRLFVTRTYETAERPVLVDRTRPRGDEVLLLDGLAADYVAAIGDGDVVSATLCCYTDAQPASTTFHHQGVGPEPGLYVRAELFAVPRRVEPGITVDGSGAVLFVDADGLWRWQQESAPRLISRGVVAVAR